METSNLAWVMRCIFSFLLGSGVIMCIIDMIERKKFGGNALCVLVGSACMLIFWIIMG